MIRKLTLAAALLLPGSIVCAQDSPAVLRATTADTSRRTAGALVSDTTGVVLMYDEQTASDAVRAAVARVIVASAPESSWRSIDVDSAVTSRELVVLSEYRYWRDRFPETTQLLISSIDSANGTKELASWVGRQLRIPPVPVRGHLRYGLGARVRAFDVLSKSYFAFRADRPTPEGEYMLARTDEDTTPAPDTVPIRGGTVTAVTVPLASSLLRTVRNWIADFTAANELSVAADGGVVPIELYGVSTADRCEAAAEWYTKSPYRRLALKRVQRMSEGQLASIELRAQRVPLTIVDWDIDTPSGHGSKVRSVAHDVLERVGLNSLSAAVRTIDLNPRRNKDQLKDILQRFDAYLLMQKLRTGADRTQSQYARGWLESGTPQDIAETHEQVLRAVYWRTLVRDTGVVNFSFGVSGPSLYLDPPGLSAKGASFGVFAAGNTAAGLNARVALQNMASRHRLLVNVTSGRADGSVAGAYSDPDNGTIVTLIAPGCGFDHGAIQPADSGSSFASPFVSTASWISMLLDPRPLTEVRRQLSAAVWPFPRPSAPIESDGRFDPWLLLAWPSLGTHVLWVGDSVTQLRRVQLSLEIDDVERTITLVHDRTEGGFGGSLVVQEQDGQLYAWYRRAGGTARHGRLVRVDGNMTLIDGRVLPITDGPTLKRLVRGLWL